MISIVDYVRSLQHPSRGNCPACYGNNSFSTNVISGNIVYYCFRASCNLKGRIKDELSVDDIRNISSANSLLPALSSNRHNDSNYVIPDYFTSPLQNKDCYNYLNRYHLIEFYAKHSDLIRYDPKLHRCVFILKDHNGTLKGASGRYLGSVANTSRWYVYQRLDGCPFYMELRSSSCTLVEDCASAGHGINNGYNFIGLLGTNVSDDTLKHLLRFNKINIALDADALAKAVKLQHQLSVYRPTSIINLSCDPKYLSPQEIKEIFIDD